MVLYILQARQESAAKAVLEAAKKAGAAGELLSKRDLQQIFQQALNPPKEQPAKVSSKAGSCSGGVDCSPPQEVLTKKIFGHQVDVQFAVISTFQLCHIISVVTQWCIKSDRHLISPSHLVPANHTSQGLKQDARKPCALVCLHVHRPHPQRPSACLAPVPPLSKWRRRRRFRCQQHQHCPSQDCLEPSRHPCRYESAEGLQQRMSMLLGRNSTVAVSERVQLCC